MLYRQNTTIILNNFLYKLRAVSPTYLVYRFNPSALLCYPEKVFMMLTIAIRSFAFLLFLLLLTSAFLQLNDPDPILWTTYYVICAIVPLLLVMKRFNAVVFWIGIISSLVIVGIYAAGTLEYLRHAAQEPLMQSMNPAKPYIEEARECIGGFITLCILLLCRFLWQTINKDNIAK